MSNNTGVDHNFYVEKPVSNPAFVPNSVADVIINTVGANQHLMFVIKSGYVEYSFNGNTVHGRIDASILTNKILDFGIRPNKQIWLQGSGTIQIHAWVL